MGKSLAWLCGRFMGGMWRLCGDGGPFASNPASTLVLTCGNGLAREGRASVSRQPQHHFHATFDIADAERPAMQLHHFLDEVQPKAGALASGAWARQ